MPDFMRCDDEEVDSTFGLDCPNFVGVEMRVTAEHREVSVRQSAALLNGKETVSVRTENYPWSLIDS